MAEAFCPQHGPYDAALGSCPYCAQSSGRPRPPQPLDDELPTDPFGGGAHRRGRADDDDAPTDLGGRRGGVGFADDDEPTEMPRARRGRGFDEEDELDRTVIERQQTGLLGWLVVKSGGRYGKMYQIKPGAIMGRDARKADVVFDDEKISAIHAKIAVKDGQFVLWDLGSSNGTYVNGQEISAATPLKENDEIKVGNLIFVLKTLGEADVKA